MIPFIFVNIELANTFGTTGGIIIEDINSAVLLRLVFGYKFFGEVITAPNNNKYFEYGLFFDHHFIKQEFIDRLLNVHS